MLNEAIEVRLEIKNSYFIYTHIPISGKGYKQLSDFDSTNPEKTHIIKRIELVRKLFEKDNNSHSKFDCSVLDDNIISVLATRMSKESTDENGRAGILYGVYFRRKIDNFDLAKVNGIKKEIFDHFFNLELAHEKLKKDVLNQVSSNEKLTENFIQLSKSILSSKTFSSLEDMSLDHNAVIEEHNDVEEEFRKIVREEVKNEINQCLDRSDKYVLLRLLKTISTSEKYIPTWATIVFTICVAITIVSLGITAYIIGKTSNSCQIEEAQMQLTASEPLCEYGKVN